MYRDRLLIAQLLKSWAQDHDINYKINDPDEGDQAVDNTAKYLSWVIKHNDNVLDLITLLDRLELLMERLRRDKIQPDGMFCRKCQTFYQFAEPNQTDGSLICYSCRKSPFYA